MEELEGKRYVGAIITIGSTSRHLITTYDHRRRLFITCNELTKTEGELASRVLEDAIADGIISIQKRKVQQ